MLDGERYSATNPLQLFWGKQLQTNRATNIERQTQTFKAKEKKCFLHERERDKKKILRNGPKHEIKHFIKTRMV